MKWHIVSALIVSSAIPCAGHPVQAADSAEQHDAAPKAASHTINPPKVSCTGNTLSISANNSELGAILSQVQQCTGVQFEAPEVAKAHLVFDEIGPGPSSAVVVALLTDSGFNYVIGASASDPEKIAQVLLLDRPGGTDAGPADGKSSTLARRAFAKMRDAARPKPPEEQASEAEADTTGADIAQPAKATSAALDPQSSPSDHNAANSPADGAGATAATTPAAMPAENAPGKPSVAEERILNMENLFEQRRKMVQQAQAPPPAPAQQPTSPR